MHLLADENILGLDAVRSLGVRVSTIAGRQIDNAVLQDVDALWVRSVTPVNEALLENSGVKFVGTATAGTEHIDLSYLKSQQIRFASAPGANANAVVEYVLAALLELKTPWERLGTGCLGIIGYGHVGRRLDAVAERLGWATRVFDPLLNNALAGRELTSLESVLRSDVVSIHCALTQDCPNASYHLIGEDQLAMLGPQQTLINAARGSIINNASLGRRLRDSSPPNVVLDVWEGEPSFDHSLLHCAALKLATPHIAGYSADAKIKATEMLAVATLGGETGAELRRHNSATANPVQAANSLPNARELIQRYYPISRDDSAFRAIPENDTGEAFDQLRRDYPLRREVASSALHSDDDVVGEAARLSEALRA